MEEQTGKPMRPAYGPGLTLKTNNVQTNNVYTKINNKKPTTSNTRQDKDGLKDTRLLVILDKFLL